MERFATSLITETPGEGLELAAQLSWEIVKMVQPSREIRERLLAIYEDDAESILMACQVIASTFQSIAAANGYWRDKPALSEVTV